MTDDGESRKIVIRYIIGITQRNKKAIDKNKSHKDYISSNKSKPDKKSNKRQKIPKQTTKGSKKAMKCPKSPMQKTILFTIQKY